MREAAIRRATILLLIALAAVTRVDADRALFSSNALGMPLQKIAPFRRDEFPYVLEIETGVAREVRRLYQDGKETHRWESSFTPEGVKKEEREIEGGVLTARRLYGATGDIQSEETYAEGKLAGKSLFEYAGGRLSTVKVLAADGALLSTESYLTSSKGFLRQVRRQNSDGSSSASAYVAGSEGVSEERDRVGEITYVTRFDKKGRMVNEDQLKDEDLVSRVQFVYRADSRVLLSSTEQRPSEKSLIERSYDEKGLLVNEKHSIGGAPTEEIDNVWDSEGHNTAKRRRSAAGIEEWVSTYGTTGELSEERYFLRGSHVKTVVYTAKDERYEELYQDGVMFLRIYYTGDKKTKEEVYQGGKLLRERSFE
jgi:antitoxin component YwqK of YwqJK toxin-antitoxin module